MAIPAALDPWPLVAFVRNRSAAIPRGDWKGSAGGFLEVAAPAQSRIGITLPILGEIATQGIPDVATMARHVEQLRSDAVVFPIW
jgi:hypothetical protein